MFQNQIVSVNVAQNLTQAQRREEEMNRGFWRQNSAPKYGLVVTIAFINAYRLFWAISDR
jgi:hypothetical protein